VRPPLPPDRAGSEDAAKEAALRLLSRGPRTEREISERLLTRGFVADAVEAAIGRLRRVALLDDLAFARAFLRRELLSKPQGRALLAAKLRRRGIPASLIAALDGTIGEEEDLVTRSLATEEGRAAAAIVQLRRRYGALPAQARRRRLEQALLRRGFSWDVIRDLLRAEGEEQP
jgi:regulatory protein